MSTKSIVNNNKNLTKRTKEIAMLMRLYVFKQRLQYKCKLKNIGYKEVDEAYTSKTCTNCGYKNDNLGSAEIFKCSKCKYKVDRDINGARNILLRNIDTKKRKRTAINKKYKNMHTKIIKLLSVIKRNVDKRSHKDDF